MGSQHSRSALQQNYPAIYNQLNDIFLYSAPNNVTYTLKESDDTIVFAVIPGIQKPHVSYTKEDIYSKQTLLEREYKRAWRAGEWLTVLSPHIKESTMEQIINKQIVEFEKQYGQIIISRHESHEALSVADAFNKSRENYDRATGTNSDSRTFMETK